jgi:hypothetical protein
MDFPIDHAYNSLFLLKIKNKKLFDGSGIFLEPVLLLRPCQNFSNFLLQTHHICTWKIGE